MQAFSNNHLLADRCCKYMQATILFSAWSVSLFYFFCKSIQKISDFIHRFNNGSLIDHFKDRRSKYSKTLLII